MLEGGGGGRGVVGRYWGALAGAFRGVGCYCRERAPGSVEAYWDELGDTGGGDRDGTGRFAEHREVLGGCRCVREGWGGASALGATGGVLTPPAPPPRRTWAARSRGRRRRRSPSTPTRARWAAPRSAPPAASWLRPRAAGPSSASSAPRAALGCWSCAAAPTPPPSTGTGGEGAGRGPPPNPVLAPQNRTGGGGLSLAAQLGLQPRLGFPLRRQRQGHRARLRAPRHAAQPAIRVSLGGGERNTRGGGGQGTPQK